MVITRVSKCLICNIVTIDKDLVAKVIIIIIVIEVEDFDF